MLNFKYQGKSLNRSQNLKTYTQTIYGSQDEIDTYISSLNIGSEYQGKGFLTEYRKSQMDGEIYQVECTYTISYEDKNSNVDPSLYGVKSASLSVNNLQLPLEILPNFKCNWKYFLYYTEDYSAQATLYFANATNISDFSGYNSSKLKWMDSQIQDPKSMFNSAFNWKYFQPTKKGVQFFDKAIFVVTETAKFSSASSAGSAVNKNINCLKAPSNTFGLSSNAQMWKFSSANINYNGKNWQTVQTYEYAGDDNGWDQDLYPLSSSSSAEE